MVGPRRHTPMVTSRRLPRTCQGTTSSSSAATVSGRPGARADILQAAPAGTHSWQARQSGSSPRATKVLVSPPSSLPLLRQPVWSHRDHLKPASLWCNRWWWWWWWCMVVAMHFRCPNQSHPLLPAKSSPRAPWPGFSLERQACAVCGPAGAWLPEPSGDNAPRCAPNATVRHGTLNQPTSLCKTPKAGVLIWGPGQRRPVRRWCCQPGKTSRRAVIGSTLLPLLGRCFDGSGRGCHAAIDKCCMVLARRNSRCNLVTGSATHTDVVKTATAFHTRCLVLRCALLPLRGARHDTESAGLRTLPCWSLACSSVPLRGTA